jgi:hypothetical protein
MIKIGAKFQLLPTKTGNLANTTKIEKKTLKSLSLYYFPLPYMNQITNLIVYL